jgi:hypothetical protein
LIVPVLASTKLSMNETRPDYMIPGVMPADASVFFGGCGGGWAPGAFSGF